MARGANVILAVRSLVSDAWHEITRRKWTFVSILVGVAAAWLLSWRLSTSIGQGQWIPTAVSGSALWSVLVLFATAVIECFYLAPRRQPIDFEYGATGTHSWGRQWIPLAVMAAGIVIGWRFFT